MLGIGYVAVRHIPCRYSTCITKLDYPWNRRQDKHNQDQYKGENKICVYWTIIGSYNNLRISHYIDGFKKHEANSSDVNVHIIQNVIR